MSRKAREKAQSLNLRVSVAIVDSSGVVILVERMDGAGILSADIAKAKAFTVIAFRGRPTQVLGEIFKSAPETFVGVSAIHPIVGGGGGMPISKLGRIVGAVGVSGAKSEEDQKCAEAAAVTLS
jgi:glc operon protein GlcG